MNKKGIVYSFFLVLSIIWSFIVLFCHDAKIAFNANSINQLFEKIDSPAGLTLREIYFTLIKFNL